MCRRIWAGLDTTFILGRFPYLLNQPTKYYSLLWNMHSTTMLEHHRFTLDVRWRISSCSTSFILVSHLERNGGLSNSEKWVSANFSMEKTIMKTRTAVCGDLISAAEAEKWARSCTAEDVLGFRVFWTSETNSCNLLHSKQWIWPESMYMEVVQKVLPEESLGTEVDQDMKVQIAILYINRYGRRRGSRHLRNPFNSNALTAVGIM